MTWCLGLSVGDMAVLSVNIKQTSKFTSANPKECSSYIIVTLQRQEANSADPDETAHYGPPPLAPLIANTTTYVYSFWALLDTYLNSASKLIVRFFEIKRKQDRLWSQKKKQYTFLGDLTEVR